MGDPKLRQALKVNSAKLMSIYPIVTALYYTL